MPRPKRQKIKLFKYDVGTINHIRVVASKDGKDLIIAEMQRKKPYHLVNSAVELKKNPNKVIVYQETTNPWGLKIFYYLDNPDWFFVSRSGIFIAIETEKIPKIQKALEKVKNDERLI
jgi:hypothetical protein